MLQRFRVSGSGFRVSGLGVRVQGLGSWCRKTSGQRSGPNSSRITKVYVRPSVALRLTGPKPKGIKVETFRIDYLIRTPKVEKLSLQPIRKKTDTNPLKSQARSPQLLPWKPPEQPTAQRPGNSYSFLFLIPGFSYCGSSSGTLSGILIC